MTAVIFEVKPPDDQCPRYFDIAATLRPLLSEIEGFIAVERFQSLSDGCRILSLYFWRDEAAVTRRGSYDCAPWVSPLFPRCGFGAMTGPAFARSGQFIRIAKSVPGVTRAWGTKFLRLGDCREVFCWDVWCRG